MSKPSKTALILHRIVGNTWTKTDKPSPGGCVMTTHINSIESMMQEKYVRENTTIGAISPDDMISRMEVDENGTIRLYLTSIKS